MMDYSIHPSKDSSRDNSNSSVKNSFRNSSKNIFRNSWVFCRDFSRDFSRDYFSYSSRIYSMFSSLDFPAIFTKPVTVILLKIITLIPLGDFQYFLLDFLSRKIPGNPLHILLENSRILPGITSARLPRITPGILWKNFQELFHWWSHSSWHYSNNFSMDLFNSSFKNSFEIPFKDTCWKCFKNPPRILSIFPPRKQ